MAKHERIEDLGVLREKLSTLLDDPLFEVLEQIGIRRPKDAMDVFAELPDDRKLDIIDSLAYGLDRVHNEIADCWGVARGDDESDY